MQHWYYMYVVAPKKLSVISCLTRTGCDMSLFCVHSFLGEAGAGNRVSITNLSLSFPSLRLAWRQSRNTGLRVVQICRRWKRFSQKRSSYRQHLWSGCLPSLSMLIFHLLQEDRRFSAFVALNSNIWFHRISMNFPRISHLPRQKMLNAHRYISRSLLNLKDHLSKVKLVPPLTPPWCPASAAEVCRCVIP